jgi:hypothetical protein
MDTRIKNLLRNDLYEVHESGEVYSVTTGRGISFVDNGRGYMRGNLMCVDGKKRTFYLHRLVAHFFCYNPDRLPQVNHIDGDKANNNHDNLEWVTNLENNKHARKTGLIDDKGHKNGGAKLSVEQVKAIRQSTLSASAMSRIYGVCVETICKVLKNKSYLDT